MDPTKPVEDTLPNRPSRWLYRLRVVDASIIPEVPSSTTNLTVIMLAERIFQRAFAPVDS